MIGQAGLQGFLDRLRDRLGTIAIAAALLVAIYMLPPGQPETPPEPPLETLPETLNGLAIVVDGDSLKIAGNRIRLYGIDAPEAEQYCNRDGGDWACGREAGAALRRKINGRMVECDPIAFDRYGRILARCRVGEEELNAWLVRQGWAVSFGAYRDAEGDARSNGAGVWAGEFQRPRDWRRERGI